MNQFGYYATSTAFSISLSKAMVDVLFRVEHNAANWPKEQEYGLYFGAGNDMWITAVRACERRGLVEHHEPKIATSGPNKGYADWDKRPSFTLTEAGKHILELCRLAELVPTAKARSFRQISGKAA